MIFVNSNYEDFASNEAMNHDFGLKPASRIKTFKNHYQNAVIVNIVDYRRFRYRQP